MNFRYLCLVCLGTFSAFAVASFSPHKAYAGCNDGLGIFDPTCPGRILNPSPDTGSGDNNLNPTSGSSFFLPNAKIRNKNWNRCLNLQSATRNGVAVNSWECVSHPDQKWAIQYLGNGYVKIRNKNWNRCLNLQSATRNGVAVNSWECISHPDQEWKIENAGNGYVKIRNKNWNRCLNLQSATQNGVAVNSWECISHPDQEWKIENAG